MPRRWSAQFADALRGVWLTARGERSFRAQLIATGLVVVAATVLRCDPVEWCLLVGCVGAVLAAEAMNAALETLFHALDADTKNRMTGCLDRAAGAVLLAALTAAVIGVIVLGRRAVLLIG